MGNFYFRPKLKPPFLRQYLIFFNNFFFYIRDPITIITLNEKSKFEENCRFEGIQ